MIEPGDYEGLSSAQSQALYELSGDIQAAIELGTVDLNEVRTVVERLEWAILRALGAKISAHSRYKACEACDLPVRIIPTWSGGPVWCLECYNAQVE